MDIVQVAAEFSPIAKAGGLGEVLVGLSRELTRLGESVEVILPKYDLIPPETLHALRIEVPEFFVLEGKERIANTMWAATVEHCSLKLLDSHHPKKYFQRGRIYGFEDDPARFLYFSRAVIEYLKGRKKRIDVLHLHDWHVSALAPLVREIHSKEIDVQSIVLTIHNVEYQGKCSAEDAQAVGLKREIRNLLQAGIEYSDAIVPVSPSYAKEILTSEQGFGLDPILRKHAGKIVGILNGIDTHLWNPATDPALPMHYSAKDAPATVARAKGAAQTLLAKRFHLDTSKRPWIGGITRIVPQKSPELLEEALRQTIPLGGTFVLLGSSPIAALQRHFEQLKERYKQESQVLLCLDYDEQLAHQLYAALDFLLVPSRFEPCGLTQMIAMHYGTVPIVRSTGGLKDTVFDVDSPPPRQNGFVFSGLTTDALNQTLRRAFHLWHTDPAKIQGLARRGMQTDFGWTHPAQEYMRLFKRLNSN